MQKLGNKDKTWSVERAGVIGGTKHSGTGQRETQTIRHMRAMGNR